jgi:protease I
MNKKALIITWQGFQDQEVIYPFYRLKEDLFDVDVAAENAGFFTGIFGVKMNATISCNLLSDQPSSFGPLSCCPLNIGPDRYDLIVLPGGVKALEKLRQQANVLSFIAASIDAGKTIASTCHGAQLLISSKKVKGKKISGYYSIKDDIENSGATYVNEPVVIDGNIVSSPHYDHMGPWMKEAIRVCNEKSHQSV